MYMIKNLTFCFLVTQILILRIFILRMNSDNVIRIGEVNKPGASAVLLEWLPLLLVACAGRLASLASVASFALLPHSHSA